MEYPRLAIVDLETTGGDANNDRITEVAILVTEGDRLIDRWSTLVNPGMHIPSRITAFTGIHDDMVRDAPPFEEVASQVFVRCMDATLVAHNARFDYGFLRAAFHRCEQDFMPPNLCTVKFSRALHPEHPRHGLDTIIMRGGYTIASRHRAMDDAEVVWRFLQDARLAHDLERLQLAWKKAYSTGPVAARAGKPRVRRIPEPG